MFVYVKISKYFIYSFFLLLAILSLNFRRFASHYEYIKQENVWQDFAKEISKNLTIRSRVACDYAAILNDDSGIDIASLGEAVLDTTNLKIGGEFVPPNCKPSFSTAIIVPYRDRDKQLKDFLTYIHLFLGKQNIHYRVYIVEQDDRKSFNRAKLLNIGSVIAIQHGFPCLVLHDVDLLPLKLKNLYACTKSPRHMSASIDKHRFNLPYKELFGGAVSLLSEQFVAANGMSNRYFGWGGEDDDLYQRLREISLSPVRLEPEVSVYSMMRHQNQPPSPERRALLAQASLRYAIDGLNSLTFIEKSTKLHPLFTHIVVQL